MTNQEANELFTTAADSAETDEQKATIELLREYFTNEEFRTNLEQFTFDNQS